LFQDVAGNIFCLKCVIRCILHYDNAE
jgi:hypothetical protein